MNEISYNMIKNRINFNNKKRVVVVTAGAAAATIMLVVSIATIGAAPFSYQQGASDRTGPRITSANIVDGEVRNEDLAPDAVTSDKIKNGEVKAEDLDPSIEIGEGGQFEFQVTERSNSMTGDGFETQDVFTVSVQCNPDEIVTGGGFALDMPENVNGPYPVASQKQDNGWSATWRGLGGGTTIEVYAECLKVVNE
jgi:hypothetical protein